MILAFRQDWMGGVVAFRVERLVALMMARPAEDVPPRTTAVVRNGMSLQLAQVSEDIDDAAKRWDEALDMITDPPAVVLGLSDGEGDKVYVRADAISHIDVGGDGVKTFTQIRLDNAQQGIVVRQSSSEVVKLWSDAINNVVRHPEPAPTLWTPPPDLSETLARARIDGAKK